MNGGLVGSLGLRGFWAVFLDLISVFWVCGSVFLIWCVLLLGFRVCALMLFCNCYLCVEACQIALFAWVLVWFALGGWC